MSNPNIQRSCIILTNEIESEIEKLKVKLLGFRVVVFFNEKFLIEDAKNVVKEAYISEAKTKYIILASQEFNAVSQNSLLKILEEPPKNIEFIIITPKKSNLLATVRSRLPFINSKTANKAKTIDFNLSKIDYAHIFSFLKENARISKNEAKLLVENLYYRATVVDKLILSLKQLENFDKAYRLLELNARPQTVLAMLVMSFTVK